MGPLSRHCLGAYLSRSVDSCSWLKVLRTVNVKSFWNDFRLVLNITLIWRSFWILSVLCADIHLFFDKFIILSCSLSIKRFRLFITCSVVMSFLICVCCILKLVYLSVFYCFLQVYLLILSTVSNSICLYTCTYFSENS